MRALAVLMTVVLIAAPAFAKKGGRRARDTTPPVIEHAPLTRHDGVGPVVIEATITDAQGTVFEPALLVRAKGADAYTRVPLSASAADATRYSATVPSELLSGDIEYVVEAFDESGNGPARAGDEAAPLVIVRDVPVQETPPPPPPPEQPPEDDGVSPALVIAGVVVGAIVVLGAAAGTGFAIYALREPAPQSVRINVSGPAPIAAALSTSSGASP